MAIPSNIGHRRAEAERSGFERLTQAEEELILLMFTPDGDISNGSLARHTFRSYRTIQTHLTNIYQKLRSEGVYDRTTLVLAYARWRGWLSMPSQEDCAESN